MLYGNSSLGKTELVREISKAFFNSKYMEKHLSMFKNGNYAEYFFGNEPNRSSIGFELLERESNLVFFDELDKCPETFYSAFYTLFDNTLFKDYTYDVEKIYKYLYKHLAVDKGKLEQPTDYIKLHE